MTDAPRKRGRPRKAPVFAPAGSVKISFPFERLPDGNLTPDDISNVVQRIRQRAQQSPTNMVPLTRLPEQAASRAPLPAGTGPSQDMSDWLNAAAEELEHGDGGRAAYYLLQALRCRELEVAGALVELAEIGQHKLTVDKSKGRRGNW